MEDSVCVWRVGGGGGGGGGGERDQSRFRFLKLFWKGITHLTAEFD